MFDNLNQSDRSRIKTQDHTEYKKKKVKGRN